MKKKVITALIAVVVILILIWVAHFLVTNFNIVEFLKQMHGA